MQYYVTTTKHYTNIVALTTQNNQAQIAVYVGTVLPLIPSHNSAVPTPLIALFLVYKTSLYEEWFVFYDRRRNLAHFGAIASAIAPYWHFLCPERKML